MHFEGCLAGGPNDMYDDLKNLISVNQHGFMKNRSMMTNLLEYSSFVLKSIEEGRQVDSVYTDCLKAFDRVRHQLWVSNPLDAYG
jgi:hypothetical protein